MKIEFEEFNKDTMAIFVLNEEERKALFLLGCGELLDKTYNPIGNPYIKPQEDLTITIPKDIANSIIMEAIVGMSTGKLPSNIKDILSMSINGEGR